MHIRTIVLLFSVGLNLVLGIGWGVYYFNNSVYSRRPVIRQVTATTTNQASVTNSLGSPQKLDWRAVESDDYATYIENLRAIGCPENTIRDIIIADVNYHYAQRRDRQTLTKDFSWWRSDSEGSELSQRQQSLEALERERRLLLTELLGLDWETRETEDDPAVSSGIYLAGPVLGNLSEEKKESVYGIAARARSQIQDYIETQEFLGQPVDPVQLGRLRQEMRTELAQVLNPRQMEEFLLRYSETAEEMRREMRGLDLSPDEFRNIFRIRDPLEQELAMLGGAASTGAAGRVRTLQDQMDAAIRQAIGPERYIEYKLNEDPAFQETRAQADRLGATPEAMFSIYEINQETREEEQRIRNDASLSPEQRIEALAVTQAEQQKALQRILGPEGFQRWQDLQQVK
ncbi:MAG: hypothetical protein H0X66_08835 [Verrucomicrobia bacterium]|nr:hypothetical protein [Verrucomicrobiota bacterium]